MDIIKLLRQQSQEIAAQGLYGWGNTMSIAADEIERLTKGKVAVGMTQEHKLEEEIQRERLPRYTYSGKRDDEGDKYLADDVDFFIKEMGEAFDTMKEELEAKQAYWKKRTEASWEREDKSGSQYLSLWFQYQDAKAEIERLNTELAETKAEIEKLKVELNCATHNQWGAWEVERAEVKSENTSKLLIITELQAKLADARVEIERLNEKLTIVGW